MKIKVECNSAEFMERLKKISRMAEELQEEVRAIDGYEIDVDFSVVRDDGRPL